MRSKKLLIVGLVILFGLTVTGLYISQQNETSPQVETLPVAKATSLRYLPLGDSYTIGQSVIESERWPNQVVTALNQGIRKISIIANPAVTGFTTKDLIKRELPLVAQLKPDFVTVQIGVNDYVRGVSPLIFEDNLRSIVTELKLQLVAPRNILLITIPDFAKTPSGMTFGDPAVSTAGIEEFNKIIFKVGAANDVPIADIFAVSQSVTTNSNFTAADGLHPSGKQYAAWTDVIKQTIESEKLLLSENL